MSKAAPRRADHPAAGRAGLRRRRARHPRPRRRRPRRARAPVRHLRGDRVGHRRASRRSTPPGLTFPWRHRNGPRKGEIDWKPLAHHTVLRVLHNPRYAGAFTYGRHRYQQAARRESARHALLPREEWISFIPGAHPGYITLDQYDANLASLTANAAAHGRDRAAGPPREGTALLQGIIICGRCGRRMTVRYHHARRPGPAHLRVPARRHRQRPTGSAPPIPGAQPRPAHRPAAHRHPHPAGHRSRPHRPGRTPAPRRRSRRAARRPRRARPLPRRPGPPPLPSRRPRQPARRRYPRSRLEHRPARPERRPGRLRQGPPATPPAAHRRAEGPDRAAGHRPARDLERPRHPGARTQAHRPAAAHRRHRRPEPATPSPRTSAWPADKTTPCASRSRNQPGNSARPPPQRPRGGRRTARPPHPRRDRRHPQRPAAWPAARDAPSTA